MILITGAGGKTGRALVRALANTENVRAFVYRDAHTSAVRASGAAEVVVGDMLDPHAVRAAVEGVRAVYHVCPNMSPDERVIGALVIAEARRAGVEHLVYHSVLHPQTEKMAHHWQKMRVEEMIFESGLPFTILQPAPYMQNLLGSLEGIVRNGVLLVPYSVQARFSFIALEDVAEAARLVLTDPSHQNAIYELAGTAPTTYGEVAEIFGHFLKRDVQAERQEIEDWKLQVEKSAMSKYAQETLARMFEYYDNWGLGGNPNTLRWLLQREPISLETFVETILKEQDAIL